MRWNVRKLRSPSDRKLTRWAAWATIIAVPVAVILGLLTNFSAGGSESASSPLEPGDPRLQRVDLIPENDPPPAHPALELLVHNAGTGSSVVSRLQVQVLRVVPLTLCYTQGDLPVSETYGLELPADAAEGEVVEIPLHQQVGPDENDRFRIDLGVTGASSEDKHHLPGLYLFELAVFLTRDGREDTLPMGTVLVSVPGLPIRTVYYLSEGEFVQVDEAYDPSNMNSPQLMWGQVLSCWRENGEALSDSVDSSAARSPQLGEVLKDAVVPSYSELEP